LHTIASNGKYGARFDCDAIEMDDTSSALAGVATNMSSRQSKLISQELHQQRSTLDVG
jgi:hypothetical protein